MSEESSESVLVGSTINEKYRVERVLGQGGMGVVVAARHVDLDDLRAIKILNHDLKGRDHAAVRFLREAQSMARIRSDHVVRVHDMGRLHDGSPYLVMEYLEGVDLGKKLKAQRVFPIWEAVLYVQQACEAIAEAHEHGIVHRDLKPANVFLSEQRDGGVSVKVLDFGIAKVLEPSGSSPDLTGTNMVLGTPAYMSPEQAMGSRAADPRSDIWALGVMLYELVTGRRPFCSNKFIGTLTEVMTKDPERPSLLRTGLPRGLEQIILQCLEKEPARRFQSATELRRALEPFASMGLQADPASIYGGADDAPRNGSTQALSGEQVTPRDTVPTDMAESLVSEIAPPPAPVEEEQHISIMLEELPPDRTSMAAIECTGTSQRTTEIIQRRPRMVSAALIGSALILSAGLFATFRLRDPQPAAAPPVEPAPSGPRAEEVQLPPVSVDTPPEPVASTKGPTKSVPLKHGGSLPAPAASSDGDHAKPSPTQKQREAWRDDDKSGKEVDVYGPDVNPAGSSQAPPLASQAPTQAPTLDPPPFNSSAAQSVLWEASNAARSSCTGPSGPVNGFVTVTFVASGKVTSAAISDGPLMGTTAAECVVRAFRSAHVPPFCCSPHAVTASFNLN